MEWERGPCVVKRILCRPVAFPSTYESLHQVRHYTCKCSVQLQFGFQWWLFKIMFLGMWHCVLWKGIYQCVEGYSCLLFQGTLLICSLRVVVFHHFWLIYCLFIQDTLTMETASSSRALVPICQAILTLCLMPDDCISKWDCKCCAVTWKPELRRSCSFCSFCEYYQNSFEVKTTFAYIISPWAADWNTVCILSFSDKQQCILSLMPAAMFIITGIGFLFLAQEFRFWFRAVLLKWNKTMGFVFSSP